MEKDCLQRLLDEGCREAAAFIECGFELWTSGAYQRAIGACDAALAIDPENAVAYSCRGIAKSDLGQKTAAILDFDRAIELDPNDAKFFHNRGVAKYELDQNAAAILDFDRAIELDPNDAKFYNNRGSAKSRLGQSEAAILDFDRAIELDPNHASAFYNRGISRSDLGRYQEARQDFLRSHSLTDARFISEVLPGILPIWSNTFPSPFLLHQLLSSYPHVSSYLSFQSLIKENTRLCRPALLWSAWQRAGQCLSGRNADWFEVFLHLGMGDPIGANRLLASLEKKDMVGWYFYQATAYDILHENHEGIFDEAVEQASVLLAQATEADKRQWLYAGLILEVADMPNEARICYDRAGDWWPASIAKARMDDSDEVSISEDFSQGLPVFPVEPHAEHWLADLETAVLFYELEETITFFEASGAVFPRFWEIWDVSALVEPLREREATIREAWLRDCFGKQFVAATSGLRADAQRFGHHFDVKMAFDNLCRSRSLEDDLSLAIDTSRLLTAEVCAALIEYFYLKGKLTAGQVFHLFFFLVDCRGRRDEAGAAVKGLQEGQKSLLENLLKPSLQLLGFFGDAAAAGMAEFLKELFRQMLEKPAPKLLGQRGEPTAYQQFRLNFKNHIAEKAEELGGDAAFFEKYPVRLFVEGG